MKHTVSFNVELPDRRDLAFGKLLFNLAEASPAFRVWYMREYAAHRDSESDVWLDVVTAEMIATLIDLRYDRRFAPLVEMVETDASVRVNGILHD